MGPLPLAILGVLLVVIAFRTFVRPTLANLWRLCGVVAFLPSLLLLVVGISVVNLVLAPPLGGTWGEVLSLVVCVVAYYPANLLWEFLRERLASFLTAGALPSREKPSDQSET